VTPDTQLLSLITNTEIEYSHTQL